MSSAHVELNHDFVITHNAILGVSALAHTCLESLQSPITCFTNGHENIFQTRQQAVQSRHDCAYEIIHMIGMVLTG